jgi:hypothetical protein
MPPQLVDATLEIAHVPLEVPQHHRLSVARRHGRPLASASAETARATYASQSPKRV